MIKPWQVWWADLDPTEGREQGGDRAVVVVSSSFHLGLTGGGLVTVVPFTTQDRPTWIHRVAITSGKPVRFAVTEQIRTISAARLTGQHPVGVLDPHEIATLRPVLVGMLDL